MLDALVFIAIVSLGLAAFYWTAVVLFWILGTIIGITINVIMWLLNRYKGVSND